MLGTFLTITPEMMTTMLGYCTDLFMDLSPVILLIIGVCLLGLFLGFIIKAFTK